MAQRLDRPEGLRDVLHFQHWFCGNRHGVAVSCRFCNQIVHALVLEHVGVSVAQSVICDEARDAIPRQRNGIGPLGEFAAVDENDDVGRQVAHFSGQPHKQGLVFKKPQRPDAKRTDKELGGIEGIVAMARVEQDARVRDATCRRQASDDIGHARRDRRPAAWTG